MRPSKRGRVSTTRMVQLQYQALVISAIALIATYLRLTSDIGGVRQVESDFNAAPKLEENPIVDLQKWWFDQIEGASRKWERVSHKRWCRAAGRGGRGQALIFVKVPKTSSSTSAGINVRIAHKVGERMLVERASKSKSTDENDDDNDNQTQLDGMNETVLVGRNETVRVLAETNQAQLVVETSQTKHGETNQTRNRPTVCSHTFQHGRKAHLGRNKKSPHLLWTFLRDPGKRAMSQFYHFEVSRRDVEPTDKAIKSYVRGLKSFQFNYIATHKRSKEVSRETKNPFDDIQRYVMSQYDFIGLLERKEESMALMKLLWGLETEDLIVMSAKQSGGWDDGMFNETCFKIKKPNLSKGVKHFLTYEFPLKNHDYALYSIVNRSMDQTIQDLGQDVVQKEVEHIRKLQAFADKECLDETYFPCSADGTRQMELASSSCYSTDIGCGHRCVDRVLQGGYNNKASGDDNEAFQ
jgi:hypothetical protein